MQSGTKRAACRAVRLNPAERLERLLQYVGDRARNTTVERVRQARWDVLQGCLDAADWSQRLLTLTVPTGGGKTLASMAFALRRAVVRPEEVRRIIVVIPFLSIIEQNAARLREALGADAVLEHHSADFRRLRVVDPKQVPKEQRYAPAPEDEDEHVHPNRAASTALENWDAPVVVTTSVRFFESLFSKQPSDLRRLHNIARSVVILDEVQTLPRDFLGPLLSMMEGLARDWCTTFLFCTATQPAFEKGASAGDDDLRWSPGTLREIVPDRTTLFQVLKRTRVEMIGDGQEMGWDGIAERMVQERRALCVVNVKKDAAALYDELKRLASGAGLQQEDVFHLSTRMCARHRIDRLRNIRSVLEDDEQPCLVVSTQLVEAGVDLDFPVVFRAMGPFDSIAQAAGRCDREGKLTEDAGGQPAGRVYVFEPEGRRTPPNVYRDATAITRRRFPPGAGSIHSPQHMRNYFEELYGEVDLDANDVQAHRRNLDFPEVAREFYMIDDRTQAVLVPYRRLGRALIDCLQRGAPMGREFWRRAQQFQVGLYPHEIDQAQRLGTIRPVSEECDLWICVPECYSQYLGLEMKAAVESNIV